MTIRQFSFDFTRPVMPIEDEKKQALLSFRVGEKFKADLEAVCRAKGIGMSELLYEYAIHGFLEDYKTILMIQTRGKSTLQDILRGA